MSQHQGKIDFDSINRAALASLPAVLARALPGGKQVHRERVALNPRRADRNLGSFKVNRYNARWCDFATGDKGGDPISLVGTSKAFHKWKLLAVSPACLTSIVAGDQMNLPINSHRFQTPNSRPPMPSQKPVTMILASLSPPVPADAPEPPKTHWILGKPSRRETYTDASGATLHHILRFDPDGERKQFWPLTLWRKDGRLSWRWKNIPEPRPLYGLDRLAARPDAPVVISEGEKSAEAAGKIFPSSVCTTSSNGSQAAAKAEWTALAGRRVMMWPDADEPGLKYAETAAAIIHKLGCDDVSIIDAMALASLTPDGSEREPVKGYDAADAVEDWQDLGVLREAAAGLAEPYEPIQPPRPDHAPPQEALEGGLSFVSWGEFKMGPKGLTCRRRKRAAIKRNQRRNGFLPHLRSSARVVILMGNHGGNICDGKMATGASIFISGRPGSALCLSCFRWPPYQSRATARAGDLSLRGED